jgi:hypothetical protein
LRIKLICSRNATLDATLAASRHSLGIASVVFSILDLAGGDIDDQLAELYRVARAFEALGCHASNMASSGAMGNPPSRDGPGPLQSN